MTTFSETYTLLEPVERKIVQALAVFGRPCTPRAISYALRPYVDDLTMPDTEAHLDRLAHEYPTLVQREVGHYFLPTDLRDDVLATFDEGEPSDRFERGEPLFTRYALLFRAADYYRQRRKPPRTWQILDDLAAQINEYELRCEGQDYETAARLLAEFSFNYLMRWGHHRLVVELRERLVDNLDDPNLAQSNLGELGSAYAYLGQMEQAIECQERALAIAREHHDRWNEGVWLANLGNRYVNLGQAPKAIEYYEQALAIARERRDQRAEALNIASLGTCYAYLGQTDQAIQHYEAAMNLARELADLGIEGFCQNNLGNIYTALGQITRAIAMHDQALELARQMGSRVEEARRLGNLADALIAGEYFGEAIQNLRLGLEIDQETGSLRGLNFKGVSLATAHLLSGDLASARDAIELAVQHDTPQNNYNVNALRGLILLRLGQHDEACQSFEAAARHADEQLIHNDRNYDALRARGLAYAGLALCDPGNEQAHGASAVESYRAANRVNSGAGLVNTALKLFDQLFDRQADSAADGSARLRQTVRDAISG